MEFDKIETLELSEQIRKEYKSPVLTVLDAWDVKTGASNVPENSNGLLS